MNQENSESLETRLNKKMQQFSDAFNVHRLYHVENIWGEQSDCVHCQKKKEFFK